MRTSNTSDFCGALLPTEAGRQCVQTEGLQPKAGGDQQHCEPRMCRDGWALALGSLGAQCDPESREQGLPENLPNLSGEEDDSKQTLVGAEVLEEEGLGGMGAIVWLHKAS